MNSGRYDDYKVSLEGEYQATPNKSLNATNDTFGERFMLSGGIIFNLFFKLLYRVVIS